MTIKEYIDSAIQNKKDITIEYVKYGNEKSIRTISNVQYSEEFGNEYITGFCQLRQEQRTFKISRIIKVDNISNIVSSSGSKTAYIPKTIYVEPPKISPQKKVINPSYTHSSTNHITASQRQITTSPINTYPKTSTSTKSSEGCYIATMVYGDYDHPQVLALRAFRDNVLKSSLLGRMFISSYYAISPKLVNLLKNKKRINQIIRRLLDNFVNFIQSSVIG